VSFRIVRFAYIIPSMCAKTTDGQDDAALLAAAARGSREALAQIARRYVPFVYNTAVRHVRDAHLAEDVTQAVFVILSRKVRNLKRGTLLHAWLFTTTRYAARNALRMQTRRTHHETKAAATAPVSVEKTDQVPVSVDAELDDAIAALGEMDRSAVLLSYFGGKNWREVGEAIGSSEDAARKRVSRAVTQMRAFFVRRGLHVSTAAVAAGLASAARAAAPVGLIESVACFVSAPALAGVSGTTVGGVISMMTWAKIKIAASFAGGLLLTIGLAGAMVMYRAPEKTAPPTTAPAAATASASLKNEITVDLLEVSGLHGAASWNGDGTPAQRVELDPDVRGAGAGVGAGPGHVIVARVVAPDPLDIDTRWSVKPARTTTIYHREHGDEKYAYISTEPQKDQKTINVRVEIAGGEWKVAATREGTDGIVMTGSVAFGEMFELDGRCKTTISDELIDQQAHIVAIDVNGQERPGSYSGSAMGKFFRQSNVEFDLPPGEIDRIEFRTRPYDQWVEFKNVSLVPGENLGFEVTSSGR
jgi:RNA polymerase sigma factor (sigma-70 family)